jgi:hypothetical protein
MTRRGFLGFFMLGGLMGILGRKLAWAAPSVPKKAMFWKKAD